MDSLGYVKDREVFQAKQQLYNAINHFHWVDPADPLMVDAAIYEYNAALARYQALLRHRKKMEQMERERLMEECVKRDEGPADDEFVSDADID